MSSVLSMPDRSRPNTESLLYALLLPPAAAGGAVLSFTDPTAPLMRLMASANFCSWITICSRSARVLHSSTDSSYCCGRWRQVMLPQTETHCPPHRPLVHEYTEQVLQVSVAAPLRLLAADHADSCSCIPTTNSSRASLHQPCHQQLSSRAQQS